jgi:UDP-glucose:(heptosyl)LPS alpha-1,3-glucosyltransferase
MNPRRIALVRQRYTAFGGAERFVARAMQALRAEGTELTIVTRQWEPDGGAHALICDPFYLGSLWRDWGFARSVCRAIAKQPFDLVQSHERIACCDIYRAGDGVHREWLAQRRRVLGMAARIGVRLNPYHHYLLRAEKKLFHSPKLKAVICNSMMVKEEIRRYFDLPESKLHVILSGVDTTAFHPALKSQHRQAVRQRLGIPQDATVYLFVGSGFERKGIPVLLQAMHGLPENRHLVVIGKDKKLKAFRARAVSLGLARRAHFLGGQPDVKPFYGAADALVLPTLYDPFPNVALEAMACGLPLLTSTKSGAAELIRNGENGYVCDALDGDALIAAMRRLSSGNLLGDAARRTVEPLGLENMAQQLTRLYAALLPGAAPRGA